MVFLVRYYCDRYFRLFDSGDLQGVHHFKNIIALARHVPDVRMWLPTREYAVVRACATLVKPGGWVFFSTINRNPKSFLFAIVGAEYVLNMLPRGTHEYAKMIRPSELAVHCRSAGLDLRQTRGMEFNPLTQRYWLSGDTSVNYLFATQKPAAAA
jgi:ubiquinone biosynthesis O-methyltransferase